MNPSEKPNNLLDFSLERAKTIDDIGELGLQGVAIIDGKTIEYSIDNDRNLKMAQSGDTIKSDALIRKIANGEIEVVSNEYKKAFGEFKLSSDNEKEKLRKTDTPAYAPNIDHRNIGEGEAKFDAGGDFSPADFRPDEEKDVAHQQKADAIKNKPEHKEIRDSKTPAYQKNSKEVDAQKVGTHWEHDAGKLELSAVEKLDNIGSMNKQELLEIMQNKKIVDSLSKEQLKQLKDRLKELLTTAGDTKNLADKLEKEVGKKKKRGPEDRERLNLRQKLYTATSSDEIKKIIQQLEAAGEKISTDSLEYQRLRLIESIENDYIGKKVSTTIAKGKTRSGTVTGIQLQTSGLGGYATRIRLVLDNNKKNAIPYEHAVKEGEKRSINETQQIIDAIDYDAESLKMKGKIVLDKNGAKIKLQQAVLSEKGQVGFSGTIEDGKTVFIDYHDLFDGLQKGDFKISIEKEENDDEKISENPNRYVGKFLKSTLAGSGYETIAKVIIEKDGTINVIAKSDDAGITHHTFKDRRAFTESLFNRTEHLDSLATNFQKGMRKDMKNTSQPAKMWMTITKAVKGQDLKTGLSESTQKSLEQLDAFLDDLTQTAETRWKEKGYKYESDLTESEKANRKELKITTIEDLKDRYRAKYMSALQVRTDRQSMIDEKAELMSDNIVGRGIKHLRVFGEKHPKLRRVAGYGLVALMTAKKATRLFSPAGALSMIAGTAAGYHARTLGEKIYAGSAEADHARAQIEGKKREYETTIKKLRELSESDTTNSNEVTQALKEEYIKKIQGFNQEFKDIQKSIEESAGRVNKKRNDLARSYDAGDINTSEYLKEDERLQKLEAKATSIKRTVAGLITIGAAVGTGVLAGGLSIPDLGDMDDWTGGSATAPEDTNILDESVTTPDDVQMDTDNPINHKIIETNQISNSDNVTLADMDSSAQEVSLDQTETPITIEGSTSDAMVKTNEGITHVFKRQLDNNIELTKAFEEKLGMDYESNKGTFLAKMAKEFGYIDESGADVRVLDGHNAGYQLQIDTDGNPSVQEMAHDSDTETHTWGESYENPDDSYEYQGRDTGGITDPGTDTGVEPGITDPGTDTGVEPNNHMSPAELLEQNANTETKNALVKGLDNFVDDFNDRQFGKAMEMQITTLMETSPDDLTSAQQEVQSLIKNLDSEVDMLNYESTEEYLNRVLADANADYTIADIKDHTIYNTDKDIISDSVPDGENLDAQQNADVAEVIDQRPRLAYKDYMDNWFEKDGAGINNWVIEGTDIHFDQISNLSAREVFYALENGNVTPEILGNQLQIPQAAADRLFDFYEETKQLAETTMGSNYVTENMTIKDIVRDVTSRRVVDQ